LLRDLHPLDAIMLREAQALVDNLEEVDDTKRPVALENR
jgi:hypothetical protein